MVSMGVSSALYERVKEGQDLVLMDGEAERDGSGATSRRDQQTCNVSLTEDLVPNSDEKGFRILWYCQGHTAL